MYNMAEMLKKSFRIRISTLVTKDDYDYVKENKLMFSRLLENSISVHRTAHEEGIAENYYNYLKRRSETLKQKLDKVLSFVEDRGLSDECLKLLNEE